MSSVQLSESNTHSVVLSLITRLYYLLINTVNYY
jgi:hypothetical protein